MKIAFLSTFYPYRGGIAQFNASLYRALEKEHEVKAFTFTRQYPDFLFPGSTQYVTGSDKADKIPSVRVLDTINPFSYFTAAGKIRQFAPEVLLMKFWMPFFGPSLGTVAKKIRKNGKVISVLDNVIPHEKRPGDMFFIRYFLRQNHGFVAMSEKVKSDVLKFLPDAKILLRQHPLYDHFGEKKDPAEARKRLGIPGSKKVLLFFGFIRDYKGLDVLIRAMSLLPESYVLLIGGETYGSFEKYRRIIHELSLTEKIILHVRYIDDSEVPYFFSAADVCVLPYKSATQSGIIPIAYHFDLPVIATDVGGLKEMILSGKTGMVVKIPDESALVRSVIEYFSENGKEKFTPHIGQFKKDFSWKSFASSLVEFCGNILKPTTFRDSLR